VAMHHSCSKGEALLLQGGGDRPWHWHHRCPAEGGGGVTGIKRGRGDGAMQTRGSEATRLEASREGDRNRWEGASRVQELQQSDGPIGPVAS
jgi:hypothetical protein